MDSEGKGTSKCPICGSDATQGCLYGGDGGGALRWFPGPARASNNLWSVIGDGDPVGTIGFLTGSYAEGIHCPRCRKVILDDLAHE